MSNGFRFFLQKYALSDEEARELVSHPRCEEIVKTHERWRDEFALAASSSSSRGRLMAAVRGAGEFARRREPELFPSLRNKST